MASKGTTTATKFEVEKFDGKVNFLLWKMRVTSLLVKEGTYKALQGISKKLSDMDEDDWQDIDVHTYFSIFHVIHVHHNHIFLLVLAILYEFWIIDDFRDFMQLLQNMSINPQFYFSYDACGPKILFWIFCIFLRFISILRQFIYLSRIY